ncbi:MAG: hypothetical protein AABY32_03275 [Nanoarchaeota archaeon]
MTEKIPTKIKRQLENIVHKYEDLEKIKLGQNVIIKNEGIMRFAGIINVGPVFLSEIIENERIKYKEIVIADNCSSNKYNFAVHYKEMVGEDNRRYNYVKEIWRNLN